MEPALLLMKLKPPGRKIHEPFLYASMCFSHLFILGQSLDSEAVGYNLAKLGFVNKEKKGLLLHNMGTGTLVFNLHACRGIFGHYTVVLASPPPPSNVLFFSYCYLIFLNYRRKCCIGKYCWA